MLVTVSYSSYPSVTASHNFSVLLQDYCDSNVSITLPPALSDVTYTIGDSQIDVVWGAISWSPTYCVMSVHSSLDPIPNDTQAIKTDIVTSTVSIFSTDNVSGIDMTLSTPAPPINYVQKIFLKTEAGTSKDGPSQTLEFNIAMTDPCFSATIDLSSGGVVPNLSPSYTIGDTADF